MCIEWSHPVLLLLLMSLHRCIHAQSGTSSVPPIGLSLRDNLKDSFSVMVVAFLSAFVFMGLFSLYLRHCVNSYVSTRNPIAAAADLLRGRLHREVINKCPILVYSAVKELKIGKSALECAVCLGEFQDKDEIRLLPKCHHVFHPDCIDAWFVSHLTCPVCRATLASPDCDDNAVVVVPTESNPSASVDIEQQSTAESQVPQEPTIRVGESGTADHRTQIMPLIQSRMLDKLPRSHSTGHSLYKEPGETMDRYTLSLPEHVREKILVNQSRIQRSASGDVVLPGVWSSKRGWKYRSEWEGGDDKGRFVFSSITPPFVSVESAKEITESSSHQPPV